MKYTLRKYNEKDYEFIYNLKKISYRKYVEQIWGAWDDNKQHEFFNNYIAKQKDKISIIQVDNEDVGYFDTNYEGNVCEIVNICLLPKHQGKGIGTDILKKIIVENKNNTIDIQCFIQNPVVKLYERLGFVEYERNKTHIKLKLQKLDNIINIYNKIESERLVFRKYQAGDVYDIQEGLNNFDVAKNLLVPFPYTLEDGQAFIAKRLANPNNEKSVYFAITLKETGELIGGTNVSVDENNIAGGGIWLNTKYHGKGYGTEAMRARAKFCFDVLKVDHLENGYLIGNTASKHMQEKIGYEYLGDAVRNCPARGGETKEFRTILTKEKFIEK